MLVTEPVENTGCEGDVIVTGLAILAVTVGNTAEVTFTVAGGETKAGCVESERHKSIKQFPDEN